MKTVTLAIAYTVLQEDDMFWNHYKMGTYTSKKKAWKRADELNKKNPGSAMVEKVHISVKKYKKLKKKGK